MNEFKKRSNLSALCLQFGVQMRRWFAAAGPVRQLLSLLWVILFSPNHQECADEKRQLVSHLTRKPLLSRVRHTCRSYV